ncbi:MAG: glycosyl hydrolase family 39 [Candidatus Sulfotelmatobacter sp.]
MLHPSRVRDFFGRTAFLSAFLILLMAGTASAQVDLRVDWNSLGPPTKTVITLQVVENPPLMRGSAIHDNAWKSLRELKTEKTRLALWYPYPRLAVAELAPPTEHATSWDFSHIDPIVEDFFAATENRSSVFTMSTIPTWMFKSADPGPIPANPAEAMWGYEPGDELRDPSAKEVADYYARVAQWYTQGGFKDELGKTLESPHHYKIAYWEVLNEPEYEHALSIENYIRIYDKVAAAVRQVTPATKFVGMSLAEPTRRPESFEKFLNPANHAPGTPLDAISYHFYAVPEPGESDDVQQFTFFTRADAFLNSVRYIENIRKRLSPRTETHINEAGCIAADDLSQGPDSMTHAPSAQYWNLCGAMFAYLYAGLAEQGIDVLGASQLVGYPTQFPSVSLVDWNTGLPNARYRVLELLHRNFGPGDRGVKVSYKSSDVFVTGYISPSGERKILLVNKRNRDAVVRLAQLAGAREEHVDVRTGGSAIANGRLDPDQVALGPFAVSVVTLPH